MARQRPPLSVVAECYTEAAQAGTPPTMAVRDRFGVAKSTAEGWVCRPGPRACSGSPGARTARNPKALAVATAPGLEYDALITAVQEHAAGNLRVSPLGKQGSSACGVTQDAGRSSQLA